MKTLIAVAVFAFTFQAQAFQKYVYTDKGFARSITQIFTVDSSVVDGEEIFDINSYLKVKIIGIKAGGYHETAKADEDFVPTLDARCRTPKKSGAKFGCYSRKFFANGRFVIKEYNASSPQLDTSLTSSSAGAQTIDIPSAFPEYDASLNNVYNITGLFFITAQKDFGIHYDQKVIYVTGLNEIFKVRLNISQKASNLEVKIDVLKHVKNANWQEDQSGSSLPGKFIYDMNRKIVTSMHLKTNSKTYKLKLAEKESRL